MKKTILTYGLISGVIGVLFFVCTFPFMQHDTNGMVVGYTGMILALSMIFFAQSTYKKSLGNQLSFKQAFKIGLWITLISSACYALMWVIAVYFVLPPDFMDNMMNAELTKMRNNGATAMQIQKQMDGITFVKKVYENPIGIFLFTLVTEPLPVGIIITLITSLILKTPKKRPATA